MSARQRGRVEVKAHRRSWMVATGLAVIFAVGAGCAPSATTPASSPTPETLRPSPTATSSPSSSATFEYPHLSRFSDPFDRFAYKSAYSDCGLIGVDGTADAFGGDPGDPSTVARAYAAGVLPDSEERRKASFRGCLDGFEAEAR
jgi:hypothetical protein